MGMARAPPWGTGRQVGDFALPQTWSYQGARLVNGFPCPHIPAQAHTAGAGGLLARLPSLSLWLGEVWARLSGVLPQSVC